MKKALVMIITVIMLSSMVAGCAKQGEKKETETNKTQDEKDTNTKQIDDKKVEEEKNVEEPMTLQMWSMKDLKYLDDDNYMTKYLEEKYNIKIEYLSRPNSDVDWSTKVRLSIASGNPPDNFSDCFPPDYEKYYKQGIIREIPEAFINECAPKYVEWIEKHLGKNPYKYVKNEDGKMFAMPKPWTPAASARVLAYRKDWAENVGYTDVPTTLDEVEELFTKFREDDPDKNNEKDTYAISAIGATRRELIESFGFVFGAYGIYPGIFISEGDKIIRGELEEGGKEALTLLNRWYKKGIIDPEFMVNKAANFNDAIFTSKVAGGVNGWYHFAPEEAFYGGKFHKNFNGEVEFEILKAPIGPSGKSGYVNPSPQNHTGLIFFDHVSDEKLKKYLQVFNDGAFDLETHLVVHRGEEGTTYKKMTSDNGEVYYEWLSPYKDDVEARYEFGTGSLATIGGFWNDYDFQRPFMVAPQYRELNKKLSTTSVGKYDELTTIVKPIYNEYRDVLDQLLAENYIKFIIGERPLEEYDQFIEEYRAAGADLVMEEAQELFSKYK